MRPKNIKSLPTKIISGAPNIANQGGIPLERKELGRLSANGRLGFLDPSARAGRGGNNTNHGAIRGNWKGNFTTNYGRGAKSGRPPGLVMAEKKRNGSIGKALN